MNHASEATVVNTTVSELVAKDPRARADAVVLTNENFDAYADKMIAGDKPPAEEPKPEPAKDEKKAAPKETAAPVEDEIDHPDKDKKGKLNERFSDLTKKRKEAEAKAEAESKRATEAAARAEAAETERNLLKAKYEPPKSDELGPKPELAQFTDAVEWGKALEDWTAQRTLKGEAEKRAQEAAKAENDRLAKVWEERVKAVAEEIPDYSEKIAKSDVKLSDQARDAIVRSDVGPKILAHFADNPQAAADLGKLTVGEMYYSLGKLAATLGGTMKDAPKDAKAEAKQAPKAEISKAPPPISPLNGGGTPVLKLTGGDKVPEHWTFEDYKRARQAGQIK